MIPQRLEQWTVNQVIDVLARSGFEDDTFDFKLHLPPDEDGKSRVRKTCCAFANSAGGFLIFGVHDNRALSPIDRLVGIEPSKDFPQHFGNLLRACEPSLPCTFRNPPLVLDNGKMLHVVQIIRSWNGPHACRQPNGPWMFYKRTNQGNEPLSMEEIRYGFLGYYEKRQKLSLLLAEVRHIEADAQHMYVAPDRLERSAFAATFDLHTLSTVFSDVYSLLADNRELVDALQSLKRTCKSLNNRVATFVATLSRDLQPGAVREHYASHNRLVNNLSAQVQEHCRRSIRLIEPLID